MCVDRNNEIMTYVVFSLCFCFSSAAASESFMPSLSFMDCLEGVVGVAETVEVRRDTKVNQK